MQQESLMRSGFSMIMAIIIIVLISTILSLSLSISTQNIKRTGDIYLQEQANLLARSSVEYAMLAISGNNNSANCINNINLTYAPNGVSMFDINMTLSYLGNSLPANCRVLSGAIATASSNFTVLIDTIVTTSATMGLSENIRIHRRTLQKP